MQVSTPYNQATLFVEPVMPNLRLADLTAEIEANVRRALLEDIGSGDITAQLIPAERLAKATIITRDAAIISGTAWVDAVFRQLDPRVAVHWQVHDGDRVNPDQVLFHLEGSRNRNSGGVGLGMTIAREATERLGGQLTLEETPGGGLTAVISLPRL